MYTIAYTLWVIAICVLRLLGLMLLVPLWICIIAGELMVEAYQDWRDSLPSPRAKRGGDGERDGDDDPA